MTPFNKEILRLAVPSILASITVPIVGMVDLAVAGHLDGNAAVLIGGVSIGTLLFDLLYWNFSFLLSIYLFKLTSMVKMQMLETLSLSEKIYDGKLA